MKLWILLGLLVFLVACTTTIEDDDDETAINETPPEDLEPITECIDSDGGRDYFVKGVVDFGEEIYTDECFEEQRLREYYCEDNQVKIDLEFCQLGICDNGKCILQEPDKYGCVDTDGGTLIKVKGVATDARGNSKEDYCNAGQIFEAYCDFQGTTVFKPFKCDLCEEGVCIEESVAAEGFDCIDTDGGSIFDVQGTVTDAYDRVRNDTCKYPTVLEEWYCDSFGFAKNKFENCNCVEGRCVN